MSTVTEAGRITIKANGSVEICDATAIGAGDFGEKYAIGFESTSHKWVTKLVVNYFNKPLDDRYADFCKRLEKALS